MPNVFNMTADAAPVLAEINRLNTALAGTTTQIETLASSIQHYNQYVDKSGKIITEYAGTVAKGFDAAGNAVTAYLNSLDQIKSFNTGGRVAPDANLGAQLQQRLGGIRNTFNNQGVTNIQKATIELEKLQQASGITAARMTQLFDSIRDGSIRGLGPLTTAERQAEVAMRRLINAFETAENAGKRTAEIMLNFRTALRLLAIQQAHLAISKITNAVLQSIDAGKEYEIRLAEIQTITQQANRSTDQWSASLVKLSNNFGTDLLKSTEAAYEAASNQIAKGADVTLFLADSFTLARTTAATAEQSVNILSSAINAYGTSAVAAARYSAILFKVADLGRVRVGEMANTFGNTATLAAKMGISIEELGASIATLTIQGIRYDTSATLVNNIILKLLKPTKEMTELLHEWGVESGEAAIATFGFAGVLSKLDKEFQSGGVKRLAELGSDMRAIRAQAALTGDAFIKFKDALRQMTDAQNEFDKAAELTANTVAFKLNKELAALNNLFVADAAQRYNKIVLDFSQSIGGLANNIKPIVDTGLNVVKILADMAAALQNVGKLAQITNDNISVLLPTLGGLYVGFRTAGVAAAFYNANLATAAIRAQFLAAANARLTATFAFLATAQGVATLGLTALVGAIAYSISSAQNLENKLKTVVADMEAILNDAAQANLLRIRRQLDKENVVVQEELTKRTRLFDQYVAAIQAALNVDLKSRLDEILKPFNELGNSRKFELNLIGADEAAKFDLVSERMEVLNKELEDLARGGKTEELEAKFKELADTAKDFTTEAVKGLDKLNKELKKFDKDTENKGLEKQLGGLSDVNKIAKLKEFVETLRKESKDLADKGGGQNLEKALDKIKEADKLQDKLTTLQGSRKKKGKGGQVDQDTSGEIRAEERAILIQQQAVLEAAKAKGIEQEINSINRNISGVSELTKQQLNYSKAVAETRQQVAGLRKDLDELTKLKDKENNEKVTKANALVAGIEGLAERSQKGVRGFYTTGKGNDPAVQRDNKYAQLTAAIKEYKDVQGKPGAELVTKTALDNVIKLKDEYTALLLVIKNDEGARFVDQKSVDGSTINTNIGNVINAQKQYDAQAGASDEIDKKYASKFAEQQQLAKVYVDLTAKVEALAGRVQGAMEQFNALNAPIDTTKASIDSLTKSAELLLKALEAQIELANGPLAGGGGKGAGHATGGFMGYAGGGFIDGPGGRDNLLIRAHRNEAIINSEAAPKFHSQITAMNSGGGGYKGLTSNGSSVNVGDVHIHMADTDTGVNIQKFGYELKRAIRSGTVKL